MTLSPAAPDAASALWTCPFCPLLCDGFALEQSGTGYALAGSDCPRAAAALARFPAVPAPAFGAPLIDGSPVTLDAALDAAAGVLAASRQPLIGGLGTDVDGARALYALACATGAISDAAAGEALLHGLRALQDRGAYTTTLAEVRNRADVIVCFGSSPREAQPEIWRRLGIGDPLVAQRHLEFVGAPVDAALGGATGVTQASVPLAGDLFSTAGLLAALVSGQRVQAPAELVALAERLRAATYAVIVWEAARLPAHGTLVVEALNRIVARLNLHTRAATLPLGGGDGAATVNQVFSWLSGLPLRSRAGPLGLEHEPVRFDAQALLAAGSVDALVWVASFGTERAPPAHGVPSIVLGGPGVAPPAAGIHIPVGTPGIDAPGHLFRTDGAVTLPLHAVRHSGLPSVAEVVRALTERVLRTKRAVQP